MVLSTVYHDNMNSEEKRVICGVPQRLNKMSHLLGLELVKLSCWFNVNTLSVNLDKSKCMLFRKKTEYQFKLSIDGFDIEIVSCPLYRFKEI